MLRAEMEESSRRLAYERAASYRDKLRRLTDLRGQFGRLRFAVESLSFVYTVPGNGGRDRVYAIRRGRVRGEMDAPTTPGEESALEQLLDEVFGDGTEGLQVPSHEIDELLLLSSWFRRFPEEMDRTRPVSRAG
jgi:excinuclease ABC subunit C